MNTTTKTLSALAGLALCTTSAHAALITGSSYSADIGPYGSAPWNDAGGDPTAPGGVAWGDSELFDSTIDTTGTGNVVGWWEGTTGAPTLTFDLGGVYDLSSLDVWRRVGNGTVTDLTISVSTDDSSYSTPVAYAPATWSSNKATIDLSGFADAQYVRVKLGPDSVSGGWLMLSEVAFEGTLVPEPGTTALLGLGGLALILRRRKQVT